MSGHDDTAANVAGLSDHVIYGFMLVGILTGLANGIAKIAIPLYAIRLNATAWQVGMVGGLQFAGTLLLSLPIGALIDRHGSLPLFRFGGIAGAILYLCAFTQMSTPLELIAGVALFSMINPFRMVATQAEFLHLLPRMGFAKAGWQRASHSMGMFFLGPLTGAVMVDAFGFAGTFSLAAGLLLMAILFGNRALSFSSPGRADKTMRLQDRLRDQLGIVLIRKDLRGSLINEFWGQVANSYFSVFVVLIGLQLFKLSTTQAASIVTLQGATFILTLFAGGVLARRMARNTRELAGFALILSGLLCLAFTQHAAFLWAGAALLGIGTGWQHLVNLECFAAITAVIGRGRAGGMFNLAGPAGGVTGALAGGVIAQHFGFLAGFQVLAAGYAGLLAWRCTQFVKVRKGA